MAAEDNPEIAEEVNINPLEIPINFTNIYANAKHGPTIPSTIYTVHGNNLIKAENRRIPNIPSSECIDNLRTFQQYSGQCWTDSISIFLLFSKEIGRFTKLYLNEDKIINEFSKWILRNKEKIEELRDEKFTYIYLEAFIFFFTSYLLCLRQRYEHYRDHEGEENEATTCKLIFSSYCQESVGIMAGMLMNPNHYYSSKLRNTIVESGIHSIRQVFPTISKYMENIEQEDLRKEALSQKFFLESIGFTERGYDLRQFARVIAVFMLFFNPSIQIEDNYQTLSERFISEHTKSFFFLRKTNDDRASDQVVRLINLQTVTLIASSLPSHTSSLVCSYYHDDGGGHALCFLTCDNNQQIVYDDNRGVLREVNWTGLFNFQPNFDNFNYGFTNSYYIYHNEKISSEIAFSKFISKQRILLDKEYKNSEEEKFLSYLNLILANEEQLKELLDRELIFVGINPGNQTMRYIYKGDRSYVDKEYNVTLKSIITYMIIFMKLGEYTNTHVTFKFGYVGFAYFTPREGFAPPAGGSRQGLKRALKRGKLTRHRQKRKKSRAQKTRVRKGKK